MHAIFRLAALLSLVLMTGCAGMAFNDAAEVNTIPAYEKFLVEHPGSDQAPEVKRRLDDLYFKRAEVSGTILAYQAFIEKRPDSALVSEANRRIDELLFKQAAAADSAYAYDYFAKTNPDSSFAGEAKRRADEMEFRKTAKLDTIPAYQDYIRRRPDSALAPDAKQRIVGLAFRSAESEGTIKAFESFIGQHPDAALVPEARLRIEQISERDDWSTLQDSDAADAFADFISRHPSSPHVAEATVKKDALAKYLSGWEAASCSPNKKLLENYIRQNPDSPYIESARSILQDIEGRNIVELIEKKRIEVESNGSGIQSVSIRLRKTVSYPVKVLIPPGTYFVSSSMSAQNMVTTDEDSVYLSSNGWEERTLAAACANRPRDIPGEEDTFSVQRSPNQEELARLMPVLKKANVSYATRQAAVWIVTDDASYDDLGILVARSQYDDSFSGSRMINALEAARAMQICDQAGIDITGKQIWSDTDQIVEELRKGSVKTWLKSKIRQSH
jgi:outer membrane protein assembly factor BamD (BamD/ComL family)